MALLEYFHIPERQRYLETGVVRSKQKPKDEKPFDYEAAYQYIKEDHPHIYDASDKQLIKLLYEIKVEEEHGSKPGSNRRAE